MTTMMAPPMLATITPVTNEQENISEPMMTETDGVPSMTLEKWTIYFGVNHDIQTLKVKPSEDLNDFMKWITPYVSKMTGDDHEMSQFLHRQIIRSINTTVDADGNFDEDRCVDWMRGPFETQIGAMREMVKLAYLQ